MRGLTLVETLVCSVLVFLSGCLAMTLLVQARTATQITRDEAAAVVDLQAASWLLTRELAEGSVSGLTVSSHRPALAVVSARDNRGIFVTDAHGLPVWQKYIVYQVDAGLRRTVLPGPVSGPLAEARLDAVPASAGQAVSAHIRGLRCHRDPARRNARCSLDWEGTTSLGRRESHQVDFEVNLWN